MRKDKSARHPTFGANLTFWRETRGYSQGEFALKFKISRGLLNGWETGRRPMPPYHTALYLARCLELPVNYLWDHLPPLQ